MDNWRVDIEYRPGELSTFIYVSRWLGHERQFLTKGGEETVMVKKGDFRGEVHFARYEDDMVGRLIVEALDKRGVKAPAQSFVQGKLEATEKHLEDMRTFAFDKLSSSPVLTEQEIAKIREEL